MGPLGLSDSQMHELMQAAQSIPSHLRHTFLQRVADELRGKALGDGLVHRTVYAIAKVAEMGRRSHGAGAVGRTLGRELGERLGRACDYN
jgi:hypothetical protein